MSFATSLTCVAPFRTGFEIRDAPKFQFSVGKISFDCVVRAAFAIEKIVSAKNTESGGDGGVTQRQDLCGRVGVAAFNTKTLTMKPVFKLDLLSPPFRKGNRVDRKQKTLGVFPLEGLRKSISTIPQRANNNRFCPRVDGLKIAE